MNTPIASLDKILRIVMIFSSIFIGPKVLWPNSYAMSSPNKEPRICPITYPMNSFDLYLLYFLRQFDMVITGLRLAPVNPPDMQIAKNRHPTDCDSVEKEFR